MKKVAFHTLGCKLNFSETSTISRMFQESGFQKVAFEAPADVYIINTCSVTDNADKKCRSVIRQALKQSPNAFVGIIGCYAQLKPKEIAAIPGVDAVFGAAEKFRLLDLVGNFDKRDNAQVYASEISEAKEFHHAHSVSDRTRTFLKVQDGCDYSCSFCTIPLARGSSRSDHMETIVAQAQSIAQEGTREIVLTGVNLGDYGIINGRRAYRFIDLIKELDQVEALDRIRISSIEPNLLTNEIIDFVARSSRFVPHFHIPLQSGSPELLRQMRRRYQRDLYEDRVQQIKTVMPDCCIGVDVITGFPGETEELFLETYEFLNRLPVSYLHVFTYSKRANTDAAAMTAQVDGETKIRRSKMLRTLSEKKRRAFYEQQTGKTAVVLVEKDVEGDHIYGFTRNYVRTALPLDAVQVNDIVQVRLDRINEKGLMESSIIQEALPLL